ncbi:MAG TPA: universal stress protein [Candidatus Acetothermia bacterium]|nr:universal stress protein [Candidatus Acetothermia bacterium]
MIIRVLLPLDCSPVDVAVLKVVEELIPRPGAEVLLLRVIHAHTLDTLTEEREKAQRCLHQTAERLGEHGLPVRMKTAEGEVAETIIRVAEAEDCNLIAMATHGHHPWERFLLGSVADVLRHRSSIPLLLVNARTHKDP